MTPRHRRVAVGILLTAGGVVLPAVAFAQSELAGTWNGAWGKSADTLAVTMRFEESAEAWSGSFDAERLRVEGIPFTEVAFASPDVTLRMVGDATTMVFTGTVTGDSLAGTFEEDGESGWFAFGRAANVPPPPREEEVRFRNGEIDLAGTLLLPDGPGPYPAVVFLHGSGPEGRWASNYLARRVVRGGAAALVWDKRGVGGSAGSWGDAGFEEQAGDGAAAVAFLRSRPEIRRRGRRDPRTRPGGDDRPARGVRSKANFGSPRPPGAGPGKTSKSFASGNFVGIPVPCRGKRPGSRPAYIEAFVELTLPGRGRANLFDVFQKGGGGPEWFL